MQAKPRRRTGARLAILAAVMAAVIIAAQTPAHALPQPLPAPPPAPSGETALQQLNKLAANPNSQDPLLPLKFFMLDKHPTNPPTAQYLSPCAGWDCVVQYVNGYNLTKNYMNDTITDTCCTDLAIYFRKQVSQGLNMMNTAGPFAQGYTYFLTLALCTAAGAAIGGPVAPIVAGLCNGVVSFYAWEFWNAVTFAESESACLTLRIYSTGFGPTPEFGIEGGPKCRW